MSIEEHISAAEASLARGKKVMADESPTAALVHLLAALAHATIAIAKKPCGTGGW